MMYTHRSYWKTLGVMSLLVASWTHSADGVGITADSSAIDHTDYSPSGLNLGQDGFWFANFNADSPQTLQAVDKNNSNHLPSWVSVDFTKGDTNYAFANASNAAYGSVGVASSDGGQSGYNTLKLPDGTTGLSGQLVDTQNATGSNSDTITSRWFFEPGAPSSEYISVVLDNVGGTAPPGGPTDVLRLRVSNFDHTGASAQATFDNLTHNGTADVYTFKLTGIDTVSGTSGPGYFSIQLRTPGNLAGTADAGLAGILFTPVPEPSTAFLLLASTISATAVTVGRWLIRR